MRRNTIPVSIGAGRSTINTFLPECRPMPLARMVFFSVRCSSMGRFAVISPEVSPGIGEPERLMRQHAYLMVCSLGCGVHQPVSGRNVALPPVQRQGQQGAGSQFRGKT
jgi:hypothetical protein